MSKPTVADELKRVGEELKRFVPSPPVLAAWIVLILVLVGTYGGMLWQLVTAFWWSEPEYGHGFFVIPFALLLLYVRRDMVKDLPRQGSWWGLAFLTPWALMRWLSVYMNYPALDRFSILPCVFGLTLLIGGWKAVRWAWPSILFLFFMLPLPGFMAGSMSRPLQAIGTKVSVFVIQTLGIPASNQGNVIQLLNGKPLGVVEACSGLRMLMLFFAICLGAALILKIPFWEKIVIVVSAVPIAILSNVARITITAILHELINAEWADWVFHDVAGLLMMPIALLMLWGEMTLLHKLQIRPTTRGPLVMGRSLAGPVPGVPPKRPVPEKQEQK